MKSHFHFGALLIALLAGGFIVRRAEAMAPPIKQEFLSSNVPSDLTWQFGSSAEGRLDIAYDDSDPFTQSLPLSTPSPSSTPGGNRSRGNYIACTNEGVLVSHGIRLDRPTSANVIFFIYESASETGTYTLLATHSVAAPAGTGVVTSPAFNTTLERGKYYLIGAQWDASATYFYKSSFHPNAFPLGETVGGYTRSGITAQPGSLSGSPTGTAYLQEVTVLTNRVLRMDDSIDGGLYSTNHFELRSNLSGYSDLTLRFRHRASGEESHPEDGVFLSVDGSNFVKIITLDNGTTGWQDLTYDLDALAANAGLALADPTFIRFQQNDNFGWPSDGREFDDISLTAPPDLIAQGLRVNGTATPDLLFKGFDSDKIIPIEFDIVSRGYDYLVSSPQIRATYTLEETAGDEFWMVASDAPWSIEPYEIKTDTLSPQPIVVPAATRLDEIQYALTARADAANALNEAFETNNERVANVRLNHYSGRLWFGNQETDVTLSEWGTRVADSTTDHWITGAGSFEGETFAFTNLAVIKNATSLDYALAPTENTIINVPVSNRYSVAGIDFWHDGGIDLSRNGGHADLLVRLPAGLGLSETTKHILEPYARFRGKRALAPTLEPDDVVDEPGSYYLAEETKPLLYRANRVTWDPALGSFTFERQDVEFTRRDQYQLFEDSAVNFTNTVSTRKKSNAAYYRGVDQLATDPFVTTGPAGDARLSASVTIDATEIIAHFPYDVKQSWDSGSTLNIVQDLVDTGSALKNDGAAINVVHERNCAQTLDCAGKEPRRSVECSPAADTEMSRDGGLRTYVLTDGGNAVEWAARWKGDMAHQTDDFADGQLYIAGHFIRGDLSAFEPTDDFGPAEILLSGMANNSAAVMERPSQANYADGLADYPGLNLRVKEDGEIEGESIIGGVDTGRWPLTGRSKYYLRLSGVSGIHECVFGSFPDVEDIYGYEFSFSNYGLSFLSNDPRDSRINGEVVVPEPADFTMAFEELRLDCLGELGPADLADSDARTLVYWDADIQPVTMFFAPIPTNVCGVGNRRLCVGLETRCANVDQTLSGILAFLPDGEIGSPADGVQGVPSRLSVPNRFEISGPGDETYAFSPIAAPYHNDHALSGDNLGNQGWINFVGNLDVAFFSDLQTHFHTSASTNNKFAEIHMMSGWEADGRTAFDHNGDAPFDPGNAGFPQNGSDDYLSYRYSWYDDYRPRAQRSWLNVVDLDYPLDWSSSSRSFRSPAPENDALLVLEVEHQTDYLSAEHAELSFGAQYDGLPQVNLANMAYDVFDDAADVSTAFGDAVGEPIRDSIAAGVDALDTTLADLPEDLFDPLFAETLDPIINDFHAALVAAQAAAPDTDYYGSVVTQYVYTAGGGAFDNVEHVFRNIANGVGMSTDLLAEIDGKLAEVETMLDAFIGSVSETNGVALPSALPGLLVLDGGDYATLTDLGVGLLNVLATTLYNELGPSLEEELNEVIASAAPSLAAIRATMLDLRGIVSDLRAEIAGAGALAQELDDALDVPDMDEPLDQIAAAIMDWFEALPEAGAELPEYSAEEIKALLRREITDAFYASSPCADAQRVIRSRLYELDAALQRGMDDAFQQLNLAIRSLASEYLNGIDDSINDMLGDVSNHMGAGRVNGYAHIRGDSLTELRLDGLFQWDVPETMEFNAYLIIRQLDADASGGCGVQGEVLPEVTLGTENFGVSWLESDLRADIETRFAFRDNGSSLDLIGLGGSFEMVEGQIGFESFSIDKLYAAVAFGLEENYLSANLRCAFTSYEVEGGAFFGRACSLAPFAWDPDVRSVLGDPPFTGVYVYGEGWMPIVDFGCLFRIKAGVGAGVFAFVDGPVGGKIFLGAEGEALCVVGVSGDVTLVGLKDGDDFRMKGKGRIAGRVGSCPFCVKFGKTVTITYDNGDWDADY